MPLSGALPRIWVGLAAILVFVCGAATAWSQSSTARMPREIRRGAIEMVVQRVEHQVLQDEILAAIQAQIDQERMCFNWPSVWLEATDRRRLFIVRYDLMARDWGAETADFARLKLQEFVDMGLLSARPRPDIGLEVVEFRPTSIGSEYLSGSVQSGRLSFCLPAHRRVAAITATEFGDFSCGTLRVRFRHTSDSWPVWARTETAQRRITQAWGGFGEAREGSVSMSRQWFAEDPTDGRENGALRSLCYDPLDRVMRGDDLELLAPVE